jgi:hypothetical protein
MEDSHTDSDDGLIFLIAAALNEFQLRLIQGLVDRIRTYQPSGAEDE